MLYRFKSRATADLIMLEPHGRHLLTIIGKTPDPAGIILVAQMPSALAAIDAAILAAEAKQPDEADTVRDKQVPTDTVSLRQRALPLQEMLRRSAEAGKDVVWGA